MVEELRYRSDEHDYPLCHPYTQLVTFEPSRRRLPPLRRRPIMGSMFTAARRRRGTHTVLGVLVGLIVGFLFASRFTVTVLRGGVINSGNLTPCASFSGVAPGVAPEPLTNLQVVSGKQQVSDPDEKNVHNSKKSLLFVGVMTAQKYLATRAKAVYETWGSEIPGRIAFFSSAVSQPPTSRPDLPLVRLKGVDDSYPPQKKSFLMLQYMWEKYGDRFEWFLRADDDVYVRADKLERLLRAVDSRKPQFIGQAGRGNQEEFGLLSLEYDENFCMGGPGVILSRETLARVAPHVKACLRNLYTTHEDVELGRCVQRFAGIPCTWSYEMQTILYHNSSGNEAFTGNLKQKEVHRAITLHPVKNYQHMYRVHNYMKSLKIQELQQQSLKLHRDIVKMIQLLGDKPENAEHIMLGNTPLFPAKKGTPGYLGDTAMLGMEPSLNKFRPRSESEVLSWDFISRSLYSSNNANPRRRIESPLREGLDDIIREVMDMINMYSKQRGRVIEYREILYGYHRVNPIFGADYILDLLLVYKKYRGRKMTVPVRRHVYVQQQFTGLEIRETLDGEEIVPPSHSEDEEGMTQEDQSGPQNQLVSIRDILESGLLRIGEVFPGVLGAPDTKEFNDIVRNKIINFILPLACRYDAFKRFLSVYEDLCLQDDQKTTLTVILYHCEKEIHSYNQSLNLLELLHQKYPLAKIHTIYSRGYFARASALQLGADHFSDSGSLLLFIDVDIIFTSKSLERIRTNTIQGKQVYFPIVFSEFDPNFVYDGVTVPPDHFAVESTRGYWRQYGYGIVSVYKSDLQKIGGFDTGIRGWGKEDVDLFDKFVSVAANLSVFRAADPHLVHVFHVVECDPRLDKLQLSMCKGSRADTYGSIPQLAQYIYEHKDEIFQFAKYRKEKEPLS